MAPPWETRFSANEKRAESRMLMAMNKASSNKKGAHRNMAKGQPIMPPAANHAIPAAVRGPAFQVMNAAAPSIPVYMAKLEGM